jgi:hypothetical protein
VLSAARRAGFAAALVRIFGSASIASAHHCDYAGCGCSTGTRHACGSGLVCCPSSPGTPGGGGVCAPRGQCGGTCVEQGYSCPSYCNWSDACSDCCSGYCGQFGACDQLSGPGSSCATGTLAPCAPGLVCCPFVPGLAGGAGTCQYGC